MPGASPYLQQYLNQQHPQGNAMGLTSNLLADALDQYGLKHPRTQHPASGNGVTMLPGTGNPLVVGGG